MRSGIRLGGWTWVPLLLLGGTATGFAEDGMQRFTSRHYALTTDVGDAYATEALAVLEAAWPQLASYFSGAPPLLRNQRLDVRVYRNRADWERYASKSGLKVPPNWAGLFDGRVASICQQRTPGYTRSLLLHECIHQFHRLACCPKGQPRDAWYTEGVAEHLCHHTWDGDTLRLGVVPPIAGPGYAAKALAVMSSKDYDLLSVLRGVRVASYPERWALVRFLSQDWHAPRYAAWLELRDKLDRGHFAIRVLPQGLMDTRAILAELRPWLATQHEPLEAIWENWQGLGARAVEGHAEKVSVARVRVPVDEIACTLQPTRRVNWEAGLLLHYVDPLHFTSAHVLSGGGWRISTRDGKAWTTRQEGRRRFDLSKPVRLRAYRSGAHVAFEVNGTRVTSIEVPGPYMGLSVQHARARFVDIAWKETAPAVSPAVRDR